LDSQRQEIYLACKKKTFAKKSTRAPTITGRMDDDLGLAVKISKAFFILAQRSTIQM
jgi:hypothetical protein